MDAFTAAFDAVYQAMPTARARIRIGQRIVIEKALCSGISLIRENSEYGLYQNGSPTVRLLATDEPAKAQLFIGAVIEVNPASQDEWVVMRIHGRANRAGILVLTLEAENG